MRSIIRAIRGKINLYNSTVFTGNNKDLSHNYRNIQSFNPGSRMHLRR
jgi:hypothetical protein